jgi:beta-lactamase superfamily II metal-dependent hydrolase
LRSWLTVKNLIAVALLLLALPVSQSAAPASLPPWNLGVLEFHQLSTGEGNAALVIFPDGTTMVVDAGAAGDGKAGVRIADYVQRAGVSRLDYVVLTHYHGDHIAGVFDVAGRMAVGTLIDRGHDYLAPADPLFTRYRDFLRVQHDRGTAIESIRVGRADQIVLRRDRAAFPSVNVRNVAANGEVWTGQDDTAARIFPPLDTLSADDRPSENMCSIGLRLRYGRFDLFTGGDMPGVPDAGAPSWQSVETAVARAIGPTDVHVANHHGSIDPESEGFLAALRSQVMILPSWSPTHPSQDVLKRMLAARLYPGRRDIFATLLHDATRASIGARAEQLTSAHGHVVVRVAPGGESYRVFVVDERSAGGAVLGVFGPYESR